MARKTVLITGCSSGIGKELTLLWLQEGHQVIGISRSDITFNYPNFYHLAADLTQFDQIASLLKQLDSYSIELFCHSAMYSPKHRPFLKVPPEDMELAYRIGVIAPLIIIQGLYLNSKNKGLKTILLNSLVIQKGSKGQLPYLCAKKALEGMHFGLDLELKNKAMSINSIILGPVDSDGLKKNVTADKKDQLLSNLKDKRFISIQEVKKAIDQIMANPQSGQVIQLGELE
jgi:3-oxoacyl-[acyl-carrier protein] reductase